MTRSFDSIKGLHFSSLLYKVSNLSIQHLSTIFSCYKHSLFLPLCSLHRWIISYFVGSTRPSRRWIIFLFHLCHLYLLFSFFVFVFCYLFIFFIFVKFADFFLLFRTRLGSSYCVLDCSSLMFLTVLL